MTTLNGQKLRRKSDIIYYYLNYIIIFYMLILTGAFFYLNYRVSVLHTIQHDAIQMFQAYSEKDLKQQQSIENLAKDIDEINRKIDQNTSNFDRKLDNILKLIIKK